MQFSEQGNHDVRWVNPGGYISTIAAGSGTSGTTGDNGAATSASFNNPSIADDGSGTGGLILIDTSNNRIRRLFQYSQTATPSQTQTPSASPSVAARQWRISRVAGTGTLGAAAYGGQGVCRPRPGADASLADITSSVATSTNIGTPVIGCNDAAGGVLFVSVWAATSRDPCAITAATPPSPKYKTAKPDSTYHVVHRVFANGTLAPVAGVLGTSGYSGEGLAATLSLLANPQAVAPFGAGYLITCKGTFRIMLLSNGVLTTAVGTGTAGVTGDGGPALAATINSAWGCVAADPAGACGGFVWADQGRCSLMGLHHLAWHRCRHAGCVPASPPPAQRITACDACAPTAPWCA